MGLNPTITKDAATGKLTLRWTRDPAAKGYLITTPTGSAIAGAQRSDSNLGVHDTITVTVAALNAGAAEAASYPPVTPPPPSVLTPHDPLNLTAGTGFTLKDFLIEASGTTRAVLINAGPVRNTTLQHGELRGGRLCHIYGATPDVWPDGVLIEDVDTHSMYEDLWHIDGGRNIHFLRGRIHDPTPNSGAHCDGIQMQEGDRITVEDTFFTCPILPRRDGAQGSDFGGGAIFAASQGGEVLSNVQLIRIVVRDWFIGRAVQMRGVSGVIDSPTIEGCGLGWNGSFPGSPPITLSRPVDGGKIVLVPGGGNWSSGVVKRSDIYFADFQGAGWPDYVDVRS